MFPARVELETASALRSPVLRGAEPELTARARLDARLRRKLGKQLSLPKLIGLLDGCALLREKFELLYAVREDIPSKNQSPHEWARHFTALLDAAGFPGERVPDSVEFQVRAKFNEVLGSRGVKRAAFANRAVAVPNELDEIIKAIQLYG